MKKLLLSIAVLLLGLTGARAQFGSFGDVPIEINAEETRFESGLAVAEHDVVIRYAGTTIYCDYAQYNPDTRDVLVQGNVRIFRDGQQFTGERGVYNLETKVLRAADFRGEFTPFDFGGDTLSSMTGNGYLVKGGIFTTSDSSKPDYVIKARTVRIYPNDRIIFQNARFYVGKTPIFWFPYLYQSLNKEQGFLITPGYSSVLGAYLLGQYTFPLAENMSGKLHVDLMSDRGLGLGFDARWEEAGGSATESSGLLSASETKTDAEKREHKQGKGWGRFRSYLVDDASPEKNKTSLAREKVDSTRYRVSLQDRTYWTEDIYTSVNINKLSDRRFLQDFFPGEFRQNPNPDNSVSITKWDEDGTLTLTARKQINEQFDSTERLPDAALDIKRQPIFGNSGVFYDGETSAGYLRRNFTVDSPFPDYDTFRADTFHQISFPGTYGGWLSLVPKASVRGTYYQDSGFTEDIAATTEEVDVIDPVTGLPKVDPKTGKKLTKIQIKDPARHELRLEGSVFRPVVNAGLEASFKFSRAYEDVQSRMWGLDGLRHVVQPYLNASFTYTGESPDRILQFDRLNRSTQLPPIDFPQFNTIDSIDNWSIVRLGLRNRLQTRRDNLTFSWLELDTFFDVNIDRPDFGSLLPLSDTGTFSNLFNRLRWSPLPWVNFQLDSQVPLFDDGFTEINTSTSFLVNSNVRLSVGHRYIEGNNQFPDSSLLNVGGYFRLGENWGFSFAETYELQDSVLEGQTYQLHRDLSSWVASLGVSVRDNGGVQKASSNSTLEYGLLLTFTLKDVPGVRIPLSYDPSTAGGTGTGKNR
ncbi:MAG: LPS assembly protein LptD [Chthoniobacteraceae bacterium]